MSIPDPLRTLRELLVRLEHRPLALYLVMGLAAALGTLFSFDLLRLGWSNAELILDFGLMALFDGALLQSLELVVLGYLALACYVVFKCCEKLVVEALLHPPE